MSYPPLTRTSTASPPGNIRAFSARLRYSQSTELLSTKNRLPHDPRGVQKFQKLSTQLARICDCDWPHSSDMPRLLQISSSPVSWPGFYRDFSFVISVASCRIYSHLTSPVFNFTYLSQDSDRKILSRSDHPLKCYLDGWGNIYQNRLD
jgi:hypothetical protein